MRGRRALCLCLALAMVLTGAGGAAASLESSIKATYLVKFGAFVDWPGSAFASPSSPFVICVEAPDPFGAGLDEAARGQTVARHPIEIRRLAGPPPAEGCHMLFLTRAADSAPARRPVLTVTDQPAGTAGKGIINFVVVDNHVRFQIDDGAASASGLRVSSQLMALAVDNSFRR